MRQLVLHDIGDMRLGEAARPLAPSAGEVQVRVRRVGICGTDLHAFAGKQPFFSYPRILGHELAVEVVSCGAGVNNVAVGDTVAVRPYLECGHCRACQRGLTNCCASLRVLGVHTDGGMREYINLPATHLHHARGVSVDGLALVEMLSIGFHAVRRAAPQADDRIVVVGLGPIGLGVALAARARGLQVSAIDPSPIRRDFAMTHKLVQNAVDPTTDVVAAAKAIADGHAADIVIDATGHPAAMEASCGIPGHGGKLVLLGIVQGTLQFSDPDLHRREITVLASRNATAVDFDAVIAALPSIDVAAWATHQTTPDVLPRLMADWRNPASGVIKGMVNFD